MDTNFGNRRKRSDATGSRRRRWLYILALLVTTGLIFIPVLQAVHDTGSFQLDGDADTGTQTVSITPPGTVDWDQVCYKVVQRPVSQGGEGKTAAQALARCGTNTALPSTYTSVAWTAEEVADSTSIFTTGSKDILDLNEWAYKNSGGLPDKDNLLHGYAARYSSAPDPDDPQNPNDTVCKNGSFPTCEILFFGSDRYDDEGSATTGVWFFQQKVQLGATKIGGGLSFDGATLGTPAAHQEGDILVTSEFTIGGTISTMKIFSWNVHCTGTNNSDGNLPPPFTDADCGEKNLLLRAQSSAAYCGSALDGDQFCGLVNPNAIALPWSFNDKDNTPLPTSPVFPQGGPDGANANEFFEGGINLSQLGLGGECFQSVLLESRTSAEPNATIKDFVLGQLGECSSGMATTPLLPTGRTLTTVIPGDHVSDQVTTLNITGIATWQGTIKFYICNPTQIDQPGTTADDAVQDTCLTGGTQVGNDIPITQATTLPITSTTFVTVNAIGKWCFRGEFISGTTNLPNASDSTSGECFTAITLQPTIKTEQTWTVKDKAQVTVDSGAGDLLGKLRFKLYSGSDCSGTGGISTLLYDSGDITVSGTSPQTISTTVSTSLEFKANQTATALKWLITYTSDNAGHNNVTSTCGTENSTLTIAGNEAIP
jgi:hypothetical protein